MKKLFSFSLLALGSVALLAFGQELTGDKLGAFEIWEQSHEDFSFRNADGEPDLERVGEYCFASFANTTECNNFADKYNLHNEEERDLADAYEEILSQCDENQDCLEKEAPAFVQTVEAFNPKLADEIKIDIAKADIFQDASKEGVTITIDGKKFEVNENNWEELVAKEGPKVFEAMESRMTEYAIERAAEFGVSSDEALKFMKGHFDEKMVDFVKEAGNNLNYDDFLLGPPIEINQGDYPDYFTQEMQTQMEGIFNLDTEEARQAAMKGFAEEHGVDGNYSVGDQDYQGWTQGFDGNWTSGDGTQTYSPGMWSDTSAWQAPEGGWIEGGYMSPEQMNQMMTDYQSGGGAMPPGGYPVPTNYTPGALLYILLDLFR